MRKFVFVLLIAITFHAHAQRAYPFALPDANGKTVHLIDFKGKVVVLDFWFTGCINCMNFYQKALAKAEQQFAQNKDVVFISICIDMDKDRWLKSLINGFYTSKTEINLYTEGKGDQHPVIRAYSVISYPQPIIIGRYSKIKNRSAQLADQPILTTAIQAALKSN
jgi:cytochrome oxidase Cu insertion factor (SCO1/SenC/PrrC family)